LRDSDTGFVLPPIAGNSRFVLGNFDLATDLGYEKLFRRLTDQPEVTKPVVGKLKSLPARIRQKSSGLALVVPRDEQPKSDPVEPDATGTNKDGNDPSANVNEPSSPVGGRRFSVAELSIAIVMTAAIASGLTYGLLGKSPGADSEAAVLSAGATIDTQTVEPFALDGTTPPHLTPLMTMYLDELRPHASERDSILVATGAAFLRRTKGFECRVLPGDRKYTISGRLFLKHTGGGFEELLPRQGDGSELTFKVNDAPAGSSLYFLGMIGSRQQPPLYDKNCVKLTVN